MKLMFILAKLKTAINFDNINIPGKVGVVATIQYVDSVKKLCNGNFIFGGQILGCDTRNAAKIAKKADSYLYVGTGKFHAIGFALSTDKDVYSLNPSSGEFSKIKSKEIMEYRNRKKVAMLKFLNAYNVGLLVTLKKGQYTPGKYSNINDKLALAEKLKRKFPKKKFYVFIFDTLRREDLDDFNWIKTWVNMACPRLAGDYDGIVNFEDAIKVNSN